MNLTLDTDLLTILQEVGQPAQFRLRARLAEYASDDVCATIISFQEQMRGWMASLNRAQSTTARLLYSYAELARIQRFYCKIRVLPYNQDAHDRFIDLQKQRIRIGTMDLRIASIALATGSMLLSRNLRDFRKVPGLIVEDWTI